MTRIRSAAQRAPQTLEAASALAARYSAASAELQVIVANRNAILAAANAAADAHAVPLVAELKDIVKQLKPWWAASIEELTKGKKKSIELAGCMIGYRFTPPKVTYANGTDDDAVIALSATELAAELTRTKVSLDKAAILKLLEAEDVEPAVGAEGADAGEQLPSAKHQLEELGFSLKQTEEFFVDVVAPAPLVISGPEDDQV